MYCLTITILIIASYVPSTEAETPLFYHRISEQKAVESLVEIQPDQVLPLVELLKFPRMRFLTPKSLEKVVTHNGRIINGTEFTSENKVKHFFFCPSENPDRYCLVPKEFQGLEPLQCTKEPKLVVKERANISCGKDAIGKTFVVFYKVCPIQETDQSDNTKTKEILLYKICYDAEKEKPIFTNHLIGHPDLLDSKALSQEHNVKYEMEITPGLTTDTIHQSTDASVGQSEPQKHSQGQEPSTFPYKMQKLTQPEDFAFASWKKSTYHNFNTALQHEKLTPLWNEINDYIRNQAKQMYVAENVDFSIQTGVFDLTFRLRDDQQSNVWVKLIIAYDQTNDIIRKSGIVILMNNFINNGIVEIEPLKATEKSILGYCEDDFCEKTLNEKFQEIGGDVRCCSVNEEFQQLFSWDDDELIQRTDNDGQIQLLRIPGINEPLDRNLSIIDIETKETLYYEPISEQEAVNSLVKIQPKNVLPIVQLLNNFNMSLVHPTSLEKVFVDEGRIINGTTFTSEKETEQVLLCANPKMNPYEYCLVPKEFHRLEPLECAEEPHLNVKTLEDVACGAEKIGKLNVLYYKICQNHGPTVYRTREIKIFEVCYDAVKHKTVFTRHLIGNPEFLNSNALSQEHDVQFKIQPHWKLSIVNTEELMAAYHQEEYQIPNQYVYKLQKFTPPEDLTFGMHRRIAYSYFNVELQHKLLKPLWDEITDHIRNEAKRMYVDEKVEFLIHTGVFDLAHLSVQGDDDRPNVWAKLVYAKAPNTKNPRSGMVILMNNFIYTDGAELAKSPDPLKKSIVDYCEDNSCEVTLKKKFENVGGQVRCCSVSEGLKKTFWWEDDTILLSSNDPIQLLRIPEVNGLVEKNRSDEI